MSIADMQRFAELRRGGDRTIADRLTLLREHRIGVERHIADLHNHLAASLRRSTSTKACSMSTAGRTFCDR